MYIMLVYETVCMCTVALSTWNLQKLKGVRCCKHACLPLVAVMQCEPLNERRPPNRACGFQLLVDVTRGMHVQQIAMQDSTSECTGVIECSCMRNSN
jgi:hypothetical protein